MKQKLRLFMMMLLCAVFSSAWGQEEVTIASFSPSAHEGWTINNAVYATAGGGYYQLTYSDRSIVSPTIDFSSYTDITITITARKYGGPDTTQGRISVSQGSTELASYSPSGTSLASSGALPIEPSNGAITISCPGASSNKGCGVSEITIKGKSASAVPTVANPTFNPAGGDTYTAPLNVSISCTTDGATIYYTTGSGDPTTVYTGPITVNETTTIKAQAQKDGYEPSSIVEATYTITAPAADYATLPFSFNGVKNDIGSTDGLTQSGLGTDYASSTNPYTQLKFDNAGDYVILHFNETPGKLSFNIKGNGFSSGTFKVQTSANGIDYTDLETYTTISSTTNGQAEEFTLNEDVRYIKWIYSNRNQGNVGLGNISLAKPTLPSAGLAFSPTEVNVNIGEVFTQPTLTNEHGVPVTYTSSNENVATVASDGTVTIVAAGTTTITASFAGNETFAESSASYTLTVVDPNAPGTENNPFTVAQAIEFISTLGGSTSSEVYVKGIISQIDRLSDNGTAQYWISDDGTTTTQLEIYSGKSFDGNNFQAENEICVDDHVVVYGKLTLYNNSVNEFASGSKIISLARDKYYVAGTWTNWQTDKVEMTKNQDGSYTLANQELEASAEFKIIKEAYDSNDLTWYGGQSNDKDLTADNHTNIQLVDGSNFNLPAGTWNFTVTFANGAPQLTVDGSWPVADYYLMGDFNQENGVWLISDNYKFTKDETTGKYTISAAIAEGQQFKIIKSYDKNVDNDDTWYGAVSNGDYWVEASSIDTPLSLSTSGNNFLMKLSNQSDWTLTFDPATPSLVLSNYTDPNATTVYEKVTSADQIVPGKKYILVCETKNKAMGDQGPNYSWDYRTHVDVAISSDYKVDIANKEVVILTLGGEEGAWTFKASDTKQYISASVAKELVNTDNADSESAHWKIISSGDGGYIVESVKDGVGTIQYNQTNNPNTSRFATYTSSLNKAYLYVNATPGFSFEIKQAATDGKGNYYATIGSLGEGNYEVSGEGVTVSTITVEKGVIKTMASFTAGDVIPGDGAYLVEGPYGNYKFQKTNETTEVIATYGDNNWLYSSGEGNFTDTQMGAIHDDDGAYKFYKLSLNKSGKIGFFYGVEGGLPFTYRAAHQAFLIVPASEANANGIFFDGTTDIDTVNVEEQQIDGAVYTLSGVRMDSAKLPKGIYIVNGKKMVVK